jgi:uncharacterized membrane protein YbhN (UPF0104 family)
MHAISFLDFLKVYSNSWVASLIVPGQAGDASIILFLKKRGIPLTHTSIVYVIDKIITLTVFICISCYGCYMLIPELKRAVYVFVLFLFVAILLLLLFFYPSLMSGLSRIKVKLEEIKAYVVIVFKKNWYLLFLNLLITIVKWGVTSLCFFLAFFSFGKRVDVIDIAVIPILSTLVGYIPISIAGLGTVEVTAGYLFSKVDIHQTVVINSYMLMRVLQYVLAILVLAIFTCFTRKINEEKCE